MARYEVNKWAKCTVCGRYYRTDREATLKAALSRKTCSDTCRDILKILTQYRGVIKHKEKYRKTRLPEYCRICGRKNAGHDRINCAVEAKRRDLLIEHYGAVCFRGGSRPKHPPKGATSKPEHKNRAAPIYSKQEGSICP